MITPAGAQSAGVLQTRSLAFNGEERTYLLYLPAGYRPTVPSPVVLVFHGGNAQAEAMLRVGFNDEAERYGFLVVYPQFATESLPDRAAFVSTLLSELQTEFAIAPDRIYATGISIGAGLLYYVICDDRIGAIAPVAAFLPGGSQFACAADRRASILQIHGTADGVGRYAATDAPLEYWRTQDDCLPDPELQVIDAAGERVTAEIFACPEGRAVRRYSIQDGRHAWPGAPRAEDDLPLGTAEEAPASMAINATQVIWQFFEAHPKR